MTEIICSAHLPYWQGFLLTGNSLNAAVAPSMTDFPPKASLTTASVSSDVL